MVYRGNPGRPRRALRRGLRRVLPGTPDPDLPGGPDRGPDPNFGWDGEIIHFCVNLRNSRKVQNLPRIRASCAPKIIFGKFPIYRMSPLVACVLGCAIRCLCCRLLNPRVRPYTAKRRQTLMNLPIPKSCPYRLNCRSCCSQQTLRAKVMSTAQRSSIEWSIVSFTCA